MVYGSRMKIWRNPRPFGLTGYSDVALSRIASNFESQ